VLSPCVRRTNQSHSLKEKELVVIKHFLSRLFQCEIFYLIQAMNCTMNFIRGCHANLKLYDLQKFEASRIAVKIKTYLGKFRIKFRVGWKRIWSRADVVVSLLLSMSMSISLSLSAVRLLPVAELSVSAMVMYWFRQWSERVWELLRRQEEMHIARTSGWELRESVQVTFALPALKPVQSSQGRARRVAEANLSFHYYTVLSAVRYIVPVVWYWSDQNR